MAHKKNPRKRKTRTGGLKRKDKKKAGRIRRSGGKPSLKPKRKPNAFKQKRPGAGRLEEKDPLKRMQDRLRDIDRELLAIEGALGGDNASKVLDEELHREENFWHMKAGSSGNAGCIKRRYFRNFVLKCRKCMKNFSHEASVEPVVKRLRCPECSHEHTVTITPSSRYFRIDYPDSVEVVESNQDV